MLTFLQANGWDLQMDGDGRVALVEGAATTLEVVEVARELRVNLVEHDPPH